MIPFFNKLSASSFFLLNFARETDYSESNKMNISGSFQPVHAETLNSNTELQFMHVKMENTGKFRSIPA